MVITSGGATRPSMRHDVVDERPEAEEAGDGDYEQQSRKERKEEVIRLLRGEVKHVVLQRLPARPLEQLAPADRDPEIAQHGYPSSKSCAINRPDLRRSDELSSGTGRRRAAAAFAIAAVMSADSPAAQSRQAAPRQKNDAEYTAKIKQNLQDPRITTELVDHLPASDTVPTPLKFLGRMPSARRAS